MKTCATGCGRPTRDVRLLCDHCLWVLERSLSEVPALLDELQTTLGKQTAMGERSGNKPTKASEQPLPIHLGAAEVDLRTYLVGWVRDIAETYDQEHPPDTLRAMSRWLLARLDIIAVHPAAAEIWDEIVGVCRQAWHVVDRPALRSFVVGPCPEQVHDPDGYEVECVGEVKAYIPTTDEKLARMACTACDATWDTSQWMRAGKRILDRKRKRRQASAERLLLAIVGKEATA